MKKLSVLLLLIAVLLGSIAAAGFMYGLALAVLPAFAAGIFVLLTIAAQILSAKAPGLYKVLSRITAAILCVALVMCAVASVQIATCYFDDEVPENTTAIVLGCGLSQRDQTSPSLMLHGRLRAAEKYLQANPEAVLILSGGQGADEKISEAEAMYRYFESRDYDMMNIYKEDGSSSTEQNINYSIELALREGLDLTGGVVIVTDGFHQYRAHKHAHALGHETFTVSAKAPVSLRIFYWVREIPGVILQSWFSFK